MQTRNIGDFFANRLNRMGDNLIDFTRLKSLPALSNHRDAPNDIRARSFVIFTTAVFGCIGMKSSNSKYLPFNALSSTFLFGLIGLALAHYPFVKPLYDKRAAMKKTCHNLIGQVNVLLKDKNDVKDAVNQCVQIIMKTSFSDDVYSNASDTWTFRQRMIERLHNALMNEGSDYWNREPNSIILDLENNYTMKVVGLTKSAK